MPTSTHTPLSLLLTSGRVGVCGSGAAGLLYWQKPNCMGPIVIFPVMLKSGDALNLGEDSGHRFTFDE